ncbi:hypothetical protein KSP40_PGU010223 [Platanthera guangdongensis]|uniref:DUF547 domain-containing protein n=1 Tax=Platanthera guangdongensis TaxID=2320717 RepID=A0ABR2MJ92_9ASPA
MADHHSATSAQQTSLLHETATLIPPAAAEELPPAKHGRYTQGCCLLFIILSHPFSGEKEDLLNETPRISNYNHVGILTCSVKGSLVTSVELLPCDLEGLYWNLERRVVWNPYRSTVPTETSSRKTAIELVKEITTLEIEIIQLEHKLLSLYRTNSDCYTMESTDMSNDYSRRSSDGMLAQKKVNQMGNYKIYGFKYDPSHKEVDCSLKCSDSDNIVSHVPGHNALKDMLEIGPDQLYNTIQSRDTNLGPASIVPCKLSEEIIRCIAAIYCKIAKRPESKRDEAIFPASLSFSSTMSQQSSVENWSPRHRNEASASSSSSKFADETYSDMVEIQMISVDGERFGYASKMLSIFRNLIKQLKSIDPRKMAHQEQIAFWLNIHNALVMHAFLAYGFNQGGKSSILKWAELLLSPSLKFMKRKQKHLYALDPPQPLVHFAICRGAHSDPPARVYRPKHILRELENARTEFIRANVKARSKTKIFLPKILSYYMKDCSLEASKLLKMVNECMLEAGQGSAGKRVEKRTHDCIVWLRFDSTFRYIICRDLAGE